MRGASWTVVILLGTAAISVLAAQAPDPAKVRECSRWCVESYASALPDGIFCIDSCGQSHPNEPVSACSKDCVVRNIKSVPDILRCINGCGRD
jgi:hypothetical protein